MDKTRLRTEILKKRGSLNRELREAYSASITGLILRSEAWKKAQRVLGYGSFRSEVETGPFLEATLEAGKKLALPRVNLELMILDLYAVADLYRDLEAGAWGIPEPKISRCLSVAPEEVDFVLVPGAAFDLQGGRIGYGKGFYDRLLGAIRKERKNVLAVGASFHIQLVDRIPREPHDAPLDAVVTERGWFETKGDRHRDRSPLNP